MKVHTGKLPFECKKCEKSFVRKKDLDEHRLSHIESYICYLTSCSSTFKTPYEILTHLGSNHIEIFSKFGK